MVRVVPANNVIPLFGPTQPSVAEQPLLVPPFPIIESAPFNQPLTFSTNKAALGRYLPIPQIHPFISQPPIAHGFSNSLFGPPSFNESSGVTSIAGDEISKRLKNAFALMQGNDLDAAGAQFKDLREICSKLSPNAEGDLDGILAFSTFLEANYGEVDDETFAALGVVRQIGKKIRTTPQGKELIAREMLMRSVAHSRNGDDDTALFVLDKFSNQDPVTQPGELRILGLIHYANMLCNRASTHNSTHRAEALGTLYQVMTEHLKDSIDIESDSPEEIQRKANTLVQFYLSIAEFFLHQHRPESAKNLAYQAQAMFPDHPAIVELFKDEESEDDLANASELKQLLQKIEQSKGKVGYTNLKAGATEFLNAASLPNGKTYWKYATIGSFLGALSGAIEGNVFDGSLPSIMMASAAFATAAVGARKAFAGITAEETKQAFKTGHTDRSFWNVAPKEAAKLLGTYVLFGGGLPFLGYLPDAWLASQDGIMGQMHGLGSIVSGLTSTGVEHTADLINAISLQGFTDGVPMWWNQWAATSPFAESVNKAIHLPFDPNPWGKIFSNWNSDKIPTWMKFTYPFGIAGFAYAVSTAHPKAKDWIHEKVLAKKHAAYLLPGTWGLTSAAMVASGLNPLAASVFTAICYAVQWRHHVQSGGDWNLVKKDARNTVDWGKMMFAGAVQLLYIGPGNAIAPIIKKPVGWDKIEWYQIPQFLSDHWSEVSKYMLDNIYGHCGMVPFLAALGVAHALLTGTSATQTLKAKYAKAWTYEIPANSLKLMLGWTSFAGNALATIIKEFGLGAIVTQSYREAGGSRMQRGTFSEVLKRIAEKVSSHGPLEAKEDAAAEIANTVQGMKERAEKLYGECKEEAAKGTAYEHQDTALHKVPLADQLLLLADSYFLPKRGRALFSPDEHPKWYRTKIYRALVDPSTTSETVEEYLDRLTAIAYDISPRQYDARRYLLIATMGAAAGKAHGQTIKNYFTEGKGKPLVKVYDLDKQLEHMTQKKPTKGKSSSLSWLGMGTASSWMRKHLKPTPEKAFSAAASTAGRRYSFFAPLTGRSLVENGAFLTSFITAAAQGDPAFQTYADPTFYRDTLYKFLMTSAKEASAGSGEYDKNVIKPILRATEEAAKQLDDNRKDVRHNLLTTIWLAQLGPHKKIIQPWINKNKHLFHANGVSVKPVVKGKQTEFPKNLKQKGPIKKLFAEHLWHSNNSTDGQVVYPTRALPALSWRMH
ncbi:MAG: hypothetical protein ABH871_00830 [Pseudomonadota bacterium]